eukprot:6125275-Amphidinium_carterae.1
MLQTRTLDPGVSPPAANSEQFLTLNSLRHTWRHGAPPMDDDEEATTDSLAIVTWNVVTLAGESSDDLAYTGKGCEMKFLAKRFAEFHFDVLALQETRIPSNGLTKVGDYS